MHILILLHVTGDEDYASGPYYVMFPVGMTIVSFNISIFDDTLDENSENFILTIDSTALPIGFFVSNDGATVSITDNDGKLIGYFFILFLYK